MPETSSDRTVFFQDLGTMEYKHAWDYQESLLQENVLFKREHQSEKTVNHLLFCEHPPVYTLGKSGKEEHLLINDGILQEKKIAFFHTNRGGDITFHGPEQIVGYPILDLEKFFTDIGRYLRCLEEVIILTISEYGIKGDRSAGETGVWIDPHIKPKARKICAMGVRCSRWITMHGFALNVNTNLDYFNYIVPCGINDKQVTSMEKELGKKISMEEVKATLKKNFEKVFKAKIEPLSHLPAPFLSTESPI
ncbi:MAG: lipoyl(octanoyl) transferase LipB [Chitinophagaceae bacterium]